MPEPAYAWLWEAFTCLHNTRGVGFGGPEPIRMGEMLAYAEFRGLTDTEDRLTLLAVIQTMDSAYLGWAEKRRPREHSTASNRQPGSQGRR